jgi:hypothetical protein
MIFGEERDQYRRVFTDAWRKYSEGAPLEPLERAIATVIDAHPEYQDILTDPESLVRDFPAEGGETNPFLHMGMHITIIEQITSDRPAGVRALYDMLRRAFNDNHALEHAMMDCLAVSLREARKRGRMPDEQRYLSCLRQLKSRVL